MLIEGGGGCVFPAQGVLAWRVAQHNQRLSRNARSASEGRYLPGLVPSGASLATACSLSAGSACLVYACGPDVFVTEPHGDGREVDPAGSEKHRAVLASVVEE